MLSFYLSLIDTKEEKNKFEQLYIQYRKLMLSVARQILQDESLAKDAVQNSFIKIIRHLNKIEDISCHKTKSFMVIVVENVSKELYRRKHAQGILFDEMEEDVASGSDVAENVIQQVSVEYVTERVSLLSSIDRNVLLLKYMHDFSDKEIANILEISPAAARKRIERARKKINTLCDEEYK